MADVLRRVHFTAAEEACAAAALSGMEPEARRAVIVAGFAGVRALVVNGALVPFDVVAEGSPQAHAVLALAQEAELSRGARGADTLGAAALLEGLFLDDAEGRAMWDKHVAPKLSNAALAAFVASCKAERTYRWERVARGETNLLRIRVRDAVRSVEELRAALAVGLELNKKAVCEVTEYGSMEALVWLLDNTQALEQFEDTCLWTYAARSEREAVEKLELLLQRIPDTWDKADKAACQTAAIWGRMDALRWLHEHGAPWNEHTCLSAACGNCLEALQYALSHGCPWDRESCLRIARDIGNEDVVAWIEQHT